MGPGLGLVFAASFGLALTFMGSRSNPQVGAANGTASPTGAAATTLPLEQILAIYKADGEKPRFDGVLGGWRVAPYEVLLDAGLTGANLELTCEPYEVGAETASSLDFEVGYLPASIKVGPVDGPKKWLCGKEALSVLVVFNVESAYGNGQIWFERALRGRQVLQLDAPYDSVELGEVGGHQAILAHAADDATGLGLGRVFLIERNGEAPYQLLSIQSDDAVPFAELVKIAEGIR